MSEKDENQDKSFNDAELQDIMNEIESLEREFVEEEAETIAEKKEETSTEVGPEAVAQEETEVVAQEEAEVVAQEETKVVAQEEAEVVAQEETEVVAQEDTDSVAEDDNDINEEAEAQSLVNEVADDFEENIVPMSKPKAKRASLSQGRCSSQVQVIWILTSIFSWVNLMQRYK